MNKMETKYFLFILLMLAFIPLTSASLGEFPQYKCVEIKTILNATSVNISTISYPNSTIAVSNQAMTKTAQTFSYTFCNTNDLGKYTYDYFDNNGNVYVNDFTIGSGNVYIFLIIAGLGVLILMFAFLMENEWLGFIAGVLFIVSGIYVAIYGIVGYSDLYTRAIAWVLIGLGFLFEIAAGYKVVENPGAEQS